MILITGGAGFIGSNLLAGLEEAEYEDIVVCDRLGQGDKWRNIAKHEITALIPPEHLFKWLEGTGSETRIVIHLGAITSTTAGDADLLVEENLNMSVQLFEWCARHGRRFVYASSAATYGDGSAGFSDDSSPDALARLQPLSAYAWSKHAFDRRIARVELSRIRSLPPQWVGLKFFNVYGPNEYHKGGDRSVIHQIFGQITRGEKVKLFRSYRHDIADGEQKRDFVWIGDCVKVLLWLLRTPSVSGLFNVGTGQARSFNDLASIVKENILSHLTFGSPAESIKTGYKDMPDSLQSSYQYFTQADTSRLRAAGFSTPFVSLEEGIESYISQYLLAKDPYL